MMGHMVPESRDDLLSCDLETGATSSTDDEQGNDIEDPPVSSVKQAKKCLNRVWSGILHVDQHLITPSRSSSSAAENPDLYFDKSSGGEDNVGLLRNDLIKDKRKRVAAKKPPKPPRPPGTPSLGIADQKLVRELSELATLKRARMERIRAQKKMRAAKSSSSSSSASSLCAMIVTLIFCVIILFQGMFSRSSSQASIEVSPVSSISSRGPLISVQYYKKPRASSSEPGTESPNLVEQVSGADPDEERNRVAG